MTLPTRSSSSSTSLSSPARNKMKKMSSSSNGNSSNSSSNKKAGLRVILLLICVLMFVSCQVAIHVLHHDSHKSHKREGAWQEALHRFRSSEPRLQSPPQQSNSNNNTTQSQQQQQPQQQAEEACWQNEPQRCPRGLTNLVYVSNNRPAGYNDLQFVFQFFGNLAAYLCARLIMPPPFQKFDRRHNAQRPVPASAVWEDYFHLISQYDQSNMLVDVTVEHAIQHAHARNMTYLTLDSYDGQDVMDQFQHLQALKQHQQPFVWGIHTSPYSWNDRFLTLAQQQSLIDSNTFPSVKVRNLQTGQMQEAGCPYVKAKWSNLQTVAIRQFLKVLNITHGFTALHIRRNDQAHKCNSTVEYMTGYLQRSYASCTTQNLSLEQRKPLLLFTDETDTEYLDGLLQEMQKHVSVAMHGDEVVRQVLVDLVGERRVEEDNFLTFSVVKGLFSLTKSKLHRHRKFCQEVHPVC